MTDLEVGAFEGLRRARGVTRVSPDPVVWLVAFHEEDWDMEMSREKTI